MRVKQSRRLGAAAAAEGAERRSEPRTTAYGEVHLRQSGVLAGSFSGRLIDTAPHGFRARHELLSLSSGQLVDFEYDGRSGLACVVWTRIVEDEVETGFRILPQSAA